MTSFKWKYVGYTCLLALVVFMVIPPGELFKDPTSTVLLAEDESLLSAHIAEDGQWRFPASQRVPKKFEQAILHFEDEYFFWHPGVNPVSTIRALIQNVKAGKVVSGGSTISMQVIRLSRKGKPRTIREKIWEMLLAVRLDLHYSKDEILALYASYAPFGGNVVGLEAASWRYYNRPPDQLSWSESCLLAVLPNAPSLIFPGRNHDKLRQKRDRLLHKLSDNGLLDATSLELALAEVLPESPRPLPRNARHLMVSSGKEGEKTHSSINAQWQKRIEHLVQQHHLSLQENYINNAAALVVEVSTGQVKAYVGNVAATDELTEAEVDMIPSLRSSGSVLKPILYASMLQDGQLLPTSLVADIPTDIDGYRPENFDERYRGAVAANIALARSYNIPAVRMLREYGLPLFHDKLNKVGFTSIDKHPDHYGLSLILGGAEVSMWELAKVYSHMAYHLNKYTDSKKSNYTLTYLTDEVKEAGLSRSFPIDAGAIWQTFDALLEVKRPVEESGWEYFGSSSPIAWKTGTSFGYRDAWAIGITPKYVVCVWVGNADGEGRPGLTGVGAAAPLLFDIFNVLPSDNWFNIPHDDLRFAEVCTESGYLAGPYCNHADSMLIHKKGQSFHACPFHRLVHIDSESGLRANQGCVKGGQLEHKSWFVLPPAQAWFYRQHHADYRRIPDWLAGCFTEEDISNPMEILYPEPMASIKVPKEIDGRKGRTVFEVVHHKPQSKIYWHLNEEYIGSTEKAHQLSFNPKKGDHLLTIVDQDGHSLSRRFQVVGE